MVEPIGEAERAAFNRRIKVAVTLLVGASAGLITLQVETTAAETAGSVAGGLLVGFLVAWFVVPSGPAPANRPGRSAGRENPFADGGEDSDDNDETGGRGSARSDDSGGSTREDDRRRR